MIRQAKDNLSQYQKVHLFVTDGFNLPIDNKTRFDLIHLDLVLHHIIGTTRSKRTSLVKKTLKLLAVLHSEKGVVGMEEMYYISHMVPHFISSAIFYGLKLLSLLRLEVSEVRDEFQPELEVNFFSQRQIEKFLEHYGNVRLIRKPPWSKIPTMYGFLLLKKVGRVSFMAGHHPEVRCGNHEVVHNTRGL